MYHILLIHLSIDEQQDCFLILADVSNTAINIEVHISFLIGVFVFFRERIGISGSSHHSTFTFLRNLHTVYCEGYTIYNPTNRASAVLVVFVFLMVAILLAMRQYLTLVVISISPVTSDVGHLFTSLLTICIPSWRNVIFKSFVH